MYDNFFSFLSMFFFCVHVCVYMIIIIFVCIYRICTFMSGFLIISYV